jgi:tRNA(Ile)-lysidine synthase TilS/MesJ
MTDGSDKLGYWLIKKINKANRDVELMGVAVSGGKDSLTLLELLHRRQRSVPTEYTLVPVHIVSGWR